MFKKLLIGTLAVVIVIAAGTGAYTALAAPATETQPGVVAQANTHQNVTTTALTAEETSGLVYMYEEEKLARDVYNASYVLWGQGTFQSIAASEQSHMDAINTLLVRYGIATPASVAGVFSNPALQALYDDLMSTSSLSLADALKVGATIEEVDIMDLQSRLALTTNADIQKVYNNLMSGSYTHLRSFTTVLTRLTGEAYQPQYLSAELYQTIISSTNRNGQSNGNGSSTTMTGHRRGAGTSTGAANGMGTGLGAGNGTGTCTGLGAGNGTGTCTGLGAGNGTGTCTGLGTGNGTGTCTGSATPTSNGKGHHGGN